MFISLDVGGTNIRVASFKSLDSSEFTDLCKFKNKNDSLHDYENIAAAVTDLAKGENIEGIGVGLPGFINKKNDYACILPNLSNWNCSTLYEDLKSKFSCEVIFENDAAAAALGESIYGQRNDQDFMFLIWGTGIGGCDVKFLDGKMLLFPCEPGHQVINPDGEVHSCGQKGCLELYCGGKSIIDHYGKLATELTEDEWGKVLEDMSFGIANLMTMRYTNAIVMGGAIGVAESARLEILKAKINEKLKIYPPVEEITSSRLGQNAGVIGALSLLSKDKYYSFSR